MTDEQSVLTREEAERLVSVFLAETPADWWEDSRNSLYGRRLQARDVLLVYAASGCARPPLAYSSCWLEYLFNRFDLFVAEKRR